jgi:HSP20 family molecular chaperone IbpA
MTQIAKMFSDFEKFDLLFKNFFENSSSFIPSIEYKYNYPVDIYKKDDSLIIEIAAVGLKKDDVSIEIKDKDVLHVSYDNKNKLKEGSSEYYQSSITKKSFDFGWKISNKFDLDKIEAKMEDGLLTINIPKTEYDFKSKTIIIK